MVERPPDWRRQDSGPAQAGSPDATSDGRAERARDERSASERASATASGRSETASAPRTLYDSGQDALSDGQWTRAIERFARRSIAAKAPRVDAAMYWTAYAQSKLGQQADALATLAELTKTYPSSRWIGDARALDIEVRRSVGQPVRPEAQADEELKLLAIQGLQHSDAGAGRADAAEVPAGPAVAEAQGAGAVRAGAEQLAAGAPGAGRDRQGRDPARSAAQARSSTSASTPPRTTGRCWRRSTQRPPT